MNRPDTEELASLVARLTARVERLEARERGGPVRAVERVLEGLPAAGPGEATVVYWGTGPWEDGTVAWQVGRTWPDLLGPSGADVAGVFAALGSSTRLDIVRALLAGSLSTAGLAADLQVPSSGQLFHHLKELLAAGLIHQPLRGTYAIRREHVVPLIAALSCALDLAGRAPEAEPVG